MIEERAAKSEGIVASGEAVYGSPSSDLVGTNAGARQVSPLQPGSGALEDYAEGALSRVVMAAPPGTLERRRELALALRALAPGGGLVALAPKDKGGARLRKELKGFGCEVEEVGRRHHRICSCRRPEALDGVDEAIALGAPRRLEAIDAWTQPGVFSWDRIDPGTALLLAHLPALAGRGADLGCGVGHLARAALASPRVEHLTLIDIDRRAVEAARRNIDDPRVELRWAAATAPEADGDAAGALRELDFVVTNPPFHDGGTEDRQLGLAFIRRAAEALRKGGALWLVANRHLPYEAELAALFARVDVRAQQCGYKVFEARR